ncbi:hypothetical protein PVAND_013029 [Polypedilum vanderplanki]|uniref:ornithine decarboxylase n=1 Tax=Polypedilum vanderplanki TaxID=319348 RepID=A0A9J6CPD8_POLVA|nr:hypothetical protein PVAND_013029 [Polypedilum vanderplanki]
MLKVVENKIYERLKSNNDNSFYLFDINDIREKVKYWKVKLPRVEPFFAVKCNYNRDILIAIDKLGLGFECASKGEVEKVLELKIDPQRIIYSHTVKQLSHLQYCAEKKVSKMTFDSSAELLRIKKNYPDAEVFLRIRIDKKNSTCAADVKFGCDIEQEALELIKMCCDLKMDLIGFNFHIGSITEDFQIYEKALTEVSKLFDKASSLGFHLNFINIGGGFYGENKECLDNYVDHINKAIDTHFPNINLIVAEPGRYFVESAGVLATQIILKRISVDGHVHYYINEGVFLSFLFTLDLWKN